MKSLAPSRTKPLFFVVETQGFWRLALVTLLAAGLGIGSIEAPASAAQIAPVQQDSSTPAEVKISLEKLEDQWQIVVRPWRGPGEATIQVWLEGSNQQSDPPLAGDTTSTSDSLRFRPRFPFLTGEKYIVVVNTGDRPNPVSGSVEMPARERTVANVTGVYPSAARLPENALKFYVHFSGPMRKGDIYQYLQIREAGGEAIDMPFLEIEQEFWSRDAKRIMLLLDPGRIKRGLQPREEMGPILIAGKTYELIVDGRWPDAHGTKLGESFVKRFTAVAPDQTQPDPANWKIWLPKTGTRNPLVIRFGESLDHSMLYRCIVIQDDEANPIEGSIAVSDHEQRWAFEPATPWQPGVFNVLIDSDLEDTAGNSVGQQFDVDVFEKTKSADSIPIIQWQFEIVK